MPRQLIGAVAMTAAERQARRRARLRQGGPAVSSAPPSPSRSPRALSRTQRWRAAVAALVDLQEEYRAWLAHLPPNLEGSPLDEKLQAIADLDLDELRAIDPPRGYGRD